MQILTKGIEYEGNGLTLTVDLGDIPYLEAKKLNEDLFSSDNVEVINITNTEVVPERPTMKLLTPKNDKRKEKHMQKKKHHFKK